MSRRPPFLQLMRQGFLGTSGHSREAVRASRAAARPGAAEELGRGGGQGLTAEPAAVVPGLEAAGEAGGAEGAPGPLLVGQDGRPRHLPVAPVAAGSWRWLPRLATPHTARPRPSLVLGPAHATQPRPLPHRSPAHIAQPRPLPAYSSAHSTPYRARPRPHPSPHTPIGPPGHTPAETPPTPGGGSAPAPPTPGPSHPGAH